VASVREVLSGFTAANEGLLFPGFENGYYYAVDCRLHACTDMRRWALVVELAGYNPRAGNLIDVLHFFGNCLTRGRQGYENGDFLYRIDNMAEVWDPATDGYRGGMPVVVRGQPVQAMARAGEPMWDICRRLTPGHRELLLADESEWRSRNLPRVLVLDDWNHPDLSTTPPSASETFQLIAEVLATGDPARHRPTQLPNTHWSNWPESGSL